FLRGCTRWLENAAALIDTVFPLFFCKQNKGFLHTFTSLLQNVKYVVWFIEVLFAIRFLQGYNINRIICETVMHFFTGREINLR
ncbi:MAG: hypothetical protein K2P38_11305, partial [Lachnospiraceae bacterium]|nr:hypothetical protein [Lachnospiraceae bacterium]